MLNFYHLQAFYTCAEHLSFSKAAEILGLSQPALSLQIKALETQVGKPLFLRNGKSISLTSKGKELLEFAPMFFDLKEGFEEYCQKKTENKAKSNLRILITDQVERPFLAEVLAKLSKTADYKLSVHSSTTKEAFEKAVKDEADMLISHEKASSDWNHVKIEFPVFFVTSSSTPEAPVFDNPNNIRKIMDYFGEGLIVPAPSLKLGKEFSSFIRKNSIKQEALLESSIISILVRFVAAGSGCSFLPLPYIKSSLYEKHLHLIGPRDGYWKHAIYIYANIAQDELESHPLVKQMRQFGSLKS